jgi:hypothetical protein
MKSNPTQKYIAIIEIHCIWINENRSNYGFKIQFGEQLNLEF